MSGAKPVACGAVELAVELAAELTAHIHGSRASSQLGSSAVCSHTWKTLSWSDIRPWAYIHFESINKTKLYVQACFSVEYLLNLRDMLLGKAKQI